MEKKKTGEVAKTESSGAVSPFEDIRRWFDESFRSPFPLLGTPLWPRLKGFGPEEVQPSIDIFEEGDNLVVKAEIPGMKKEDIDVNITDDMITISGEKKKEEKVEKKNYYRFERSYGSFCRSFLLPKEVQTDKAKAKFKDGVLEIKIPVTEEAKKREKKIPVE